VNEAVREPQDRADYEHNQHYGGDVVRAAASEDAPRLKKGAGSHADAHGSHDPVEDLDRLHTIEYALPASGIHHSRDNHHLIAYALR
jgi:hypothetical protein